MLLDLNHFGVTHNLHWKLQSLQILYMNKVNGNWQFFLSPILLVIAKWIPNVRVCFDITSFHIGWFKWCIEKASKIIGIQQGSSQTNIKFQHVASAQEKELCKTSSIIKSRGHTTWVPCLELEGAFSPKTGGLLITPWICIASPSLSFGGPCETSTPFLLQWENEFPTTQIPFINSLLYAFSSFLLSSNLLEVLCPLKSIHVIKFSITKTHSQNLIFLLALWTYWCLSSSWSPWNFHTLLLLLSSRLVINPSFHRSFLFIFSSPRTSHHWRYVHVYRFRAHIHSSLSWTQVVDFHLIIEDRVGNVGLISENVLSVPSRLHYCHDSCFTSRCVLFADFTQCPCLALW